MRIPDEKAEAVKAALGMARAVLKAGGKPADALPAIKTAEELLAGSLEPSRAARGQARGPLGGPGRRKPKRSRTATVGPARPTVM